MLDRWTTQLISPPLGLLAKILKSGGITPDQVTFTGFLIGLLSIPLLAFQLYDFALIGYSM